MNARSMLDWWHSEVRTAGTGATSITLPVFRYTYCVWIKQLHFVALTVKYRFSTNVTVSAQHSHVAFRSFLLIPNNPVSHRLLPGNMRFCLSSCLLIKWGPRIKETWSVKKFRSGFEFKSKRHIWFKENKIITHTLHVQRSALPWGSSPEARMYFTLSTLSS